MRRALSREKARVERSGRYFALVVFEAASEVTLEWLLAAGSELVSRARGSDYIGQFDHRRLAALLPETLPSSGWTFGENMLELLSQKGFDFQCEVFGYPPPPDRFPPERDEDERKPPQHGTNGSTNGSANGSAGGSASGSAGGSANGSAGGSTNGSAGGSTNGSASGSASGSAPQAERGGSGAPPLAPTQKEARAPESRPVHDLSSAFFLPMPQWKRAMDIVGSLALLLLALPLGLLIALAIKLTSRGPVIFIQQRAGLGGKPFPFYKFRTMVVDAEERKESLRSRNEHRGPTFKVIDDPRVTAVGKLLRASSLDELPQLWNVLRGDMSLVGPRPPTMDEVPHYDVWQLGRLHLTGGLTCSWQVSGRCQVPFVDWVRMDLRYAKTRSMTKDLLLIAKTPIAVARGDGAY